MKSIGEAIGLAITVIVIAGLINVQGLISNYHALVGCR